MKDVRAASKAELAAKLTKREVSKHGGYELLYLDGPDSYRVNDISITPSGTYVAGLSPLRVTADSDDLPRVRLKMYILGQEPIMHGDTLKVGCVRATVERTTIVTSNTCRALKDGHSKVKIPPYGDNGYAVPVKSIVQLCKKLRHFPQYKKAAERILEAAALYKKKGKKTKEKKQKQKRK